MRWRKNLLLSATLLVVHAGNAQFVDSFSDGDFLVSPVWQGETGLFSVVNNRLKLQAPAVSGTAQMTTVSKAIYEAAWEFTIQMDFTPSSSNYARIYLVADQPDFRLPTKGYFVKVGHTSREVSLCRQTASSETEIIDGLDDRLNLPTVNVRVRVTRDGDGNWELFSDVGLTGHYVSEGKATDQAHTGSSWFGVQCVFTSTRSDKFWFDDFTVTGSEIPDRQPPGVVGAEATGPKEFQIWFTEWIDPSTIQTTSVWVDGMGHPTSISPSEGGTAVQCLLSEPLKNGVTYNMTVSEIADSSGNVMPLTNWLIRYFKPGVPMPKSVLITELFPDPSPQIGLPSVEFVELYNPGAEPFDLKNWKLTDGSSTGLFPEFILLPKAYVTVTSSAGASLFGDISVVGLLNFASLNNGGDKLRLSDDNAQPIDSVNYSSDWFRDEDKMNGGWSLELIDPSNPCGEADNWAASEDPRGGTPGEPNSILSNKPDLSPPIVLAVRTIDSMRISLRFNELLEATSAHEVYAEGSTAITLFDVELDGSRKGIELTFAEPLQTRTSYQLLLKGVRDCNGNAMEPAQILFGLPEPADSLDILLSEVLFNPRPGGVDFVEIHNASKKFVDLEGWTLSNGTMESSLPTIQLPPGEWLALAQDPETVKAQYLLAVGGKMVHCDIPSLPDDGGELSLLNSQGHTLDHLDYSEDWHTSFLRTTEGVSLERISFFTPTQSSENWISASSVSGFATPGLPNSCLRSSSLVSAGVVVLPEVFSPGIGSLGFVEIHYRFDHPGYVANMVIYDAHGIPVKVLADNATLGSEGVMRWDGDRDDGSRAPAGYYVLWIECFDSSGRMETIRRRIVVATP